MRSIYLICGLLVLCTSVYAKVNTNTIDTSGNRLSTEAYVTNYVSQVTTNQLGDIRYIGADGTWSTLSYDPTNYVLVDGLSFIPQVGQLVRIPNTNNVYVWRSIIHTNYDIDGLWLQLTGLPDLSNAGPGSGMEWMAAELPLYSENPTDNNQLANKLYVDSQIQSSTSGFISVESDPEFYDFKTNTVITLGNGASASMDGGLAVGYYAVGTLAGLAVGWGANGDNNGLAVGYNANGIDYGIGIGNTGKGKLHGVGVGTSSDGSSNGVAIGYFAVGNNRGVAIGANATASFTNVAVGADSSASGDNANAFGYGAINTTPNSVVLGNGNVTQTVLRGSVGIGTVSPTTPLHVLGNSAGYIYTTVENTNASGAGSGVKLVGPLATSEIYSKGIGDPDLQNGDALNLIHKGAYRVRLSDSGLYANMPFKVSSTGGGAYLTMINTNKGTVDTFGMDFSFWDLVGTSHDFGVYADVIDNSDLTPNAALVLESYYEGSAYERVRIDPTGTVRVSGDILPSSSNTYSLGSLAYPWSDLYLDTNTLWLGSYALTVSTGGTLQVVDNTTTTPPPPVIYADTNYVAVYVEGKGYATTNYVTGQGYLTSASDLNGSRINTGTVSQLYIDAAVTRDAEVTYALVMDQGVATTNSPTFVYPKVSNLEISTEGLSGSSMQAFNNSLAMGYAGPGSINVATGFASSISAYNIGLSTNTASGQASVIRVANAGNSVVSVSGNASTAIGNPAFSSHNEALVVDGAVSDASIYWTLNQNAKVRVPGNAAHTRVYTDHSLGSVVVSGNGSEVEGFVSQAVITNSGSGSSISGYFDDFLAGDTITVEANGARFLGYAQTGQYGITIPSAGPGATIMGFVGTAGVASNAGAGATMLGYIATGSAEITEDGDGSVTIGNAKSTNQNALVVGNAQVSHGAGSVTAAGGFYTPITSWHYWGSDGVEGSWRQGVTGGVFVVQTYSGGVWTNAALYTAP